MAIHDVDKNNNDRSSPVVNAHDLTPEQRMAHGTTSIHPVTDATSGSGYIQTKNSRILTFDGTTNRVLITPTQIKVSQAGNDVTTATDDKLIFNSNQDVFKIVLSGTLTVSKAASSSSGVASINHGLSFIPSYLVYMFDSGGPFYAGMPYVIISASTGVVSELHYAFVDSTFFSVQSITPNWAGNGAYTNAFSRTFKYYLLQETAN